MEAAYEQVEHLHPDEQAYEQICFEMLTGALETHARKILLFVDNLGENAAELW